MPFIGKQPQAGAYSKLDSITTSATATYNLTLGGSAYYPSSANHLLVSLNGVLQAPQDSFTVSGSQITFASALTSADSIDFIMALGDVLDIGTPSAGATVPGAFNVQDDFTVGSRVTIDPGARAGVNEIKSYSNTTSSYMEMHFDASSFRFYDSANGTHDSSTEALRVNSSGVSFDAGSNYLDVYEEGTWTVSFHDEASGGNTSATTGTGYYTRIGRQVTAIFSIANIDSTGMTGVNNFYFSLPYTSSSNTLYTGSVRLYANVHDSTISLCSQINAGHSRGVLTESRDATTLDNPIWSDFVDDASDISVSITYFV